MDQLGCCVVSHFRLLVDYWWMVLSSQFSVLKPHINYAVKCEDPVVGYVPVRVCVHHMRKFHIYAYT
jgi:hypothetical protein